MRTRIKREGLNRMNIIMLSKNKKVRIEQDKDHENKKRQGLNRIRIIRLNKKKREGLNRIRIMRTRIKREGLIRIKIIMLNKNKKGRIEQDKDHHAEQE